MRLRQASLKGGTLCCLASFLCIFIWGHHLTCTINMHLCTPWPRALFWMIQAGQQGLEGASIDPARFSALPLNCSGQRQQRHRRWVSNDGDKGGDKTISFLLVACGKKARYPALDTIVRIHLCSSKARFSFAYCPGSNYETPVLAVLVVLYSSGIHNCSRERGHRALSRKVDMCVSFLCPGR